MWVLIFADYFFLIFHSLLIVFNLFGWLFPISQKLHFYCITITLSSWLILGYFYGWGYCFLTDWHFEVLEILGVRDLPRSYITYLIQRLFEINLSDQLVMTLTAWIFSIPVIGSLWVNRKMFSSTKR